MTYGWRRAEVVGALANGVFLLALCLNIIIESIQRFFDIQGKFSKDSNHLSEIKDPIWLLGVGGVGLVINILGLFLFHDHGGHGHSHGHGHSESVPPSPMITKASS